MKASRGRLALACASLIALTAASPALAQQLPDQAYRPDGIRVPTQGVAIITKDSISGNWCVAGSTSTCTLPGLPAGGAVTITGSALTDLDGILAALLTPATSVPPTAPVASADTTLTAATATISASGDTTLVSATSAQSTRVHRMFCTIAGATTVTFKSAATSLKAFDFPSTGGFINWAYAPYWHLKTANNEALILNSSNAVAIKCALDYVKGA